MFPSRTPRPSSEPSKKEMLPPPPVSSSSSSSSSQKPSKPAQKRPRREADPSSQDASQSASSSKGNHKDSSTPKHRKVEGKGSGSSTEHKVSRQGWNLTERNTSTHHYIFTLNSQIREVPNDDFSELFITVNKAIMSYLCLNL